MKRTHREKELSQLQKAVRENKRLKQQVAQLRKLVSKFDLDRFNDFKELVETNEKLEERFRKQEARKQLKEKWQCWACRTGILRIVVLPRRDGVFYFRKCSECDNRTKTKTYDASVEGIKEDE